MISVKNLCFGYIKQPLCLKDVCFDLKAGETLGVYGGEGMGKTALLRVLCGLEKQYAGSIKINNKELSGQDLKLMGCSFLPSDPVFFENKTIRQNLEYLFKTQNIEPLSSEEIDKIFKKFNFEHDLNLKVKKLTLKEKRILAMIRSYIKQSTFLLIDDQTTGIDESETRCVKNAILTLLDSKNTIKTAVLAFNCKKSVIETTRKIYLSFSKYSVVNSVADFYNKDIFALNYVPYNCRDFVLKKQGSYFLFDYEVAKEKKKKQTILKQQYKLNSKYEFHLEEGDQIFVKLCSPIDVELDCLSDEQIEKLLVSGKAHIFDILCGDKLL